MTPTTLARKRIFWLSALALFTALACRLTAYQAEPPSVQFITPNDAEHEYFVNEPVEIAFFAQGENEIPYVQVTLGTPDGELIASYGSPDGPGKTQLRETMTWTPSMKGRFTLYMTAYDNLGRPGQSVHRSIQVYPKPTVIASGSKSFAHGESFDFVSGEIGEFNGGDLLFYREGPADFRMAANYPPQAGGTRLSVAYDIYDIQNVLFQKEVIRAIMAADQDDPFVIDEFKVEEFGLYLYKRHAQPGDYILFMITGIEDESFSLDYTVFSLP